MKGVDYNDIVLQLTFTIKMGQLLVTGAVCVVGNALCQPIYIPNGVSASTSTGMDLNFI